MFAPACAEARDTADATSPARLVLAAAAILLLIGCGGGGHSGATAGSSRVTAAHQVSAAVNARCSGASLPATAQTGTDVQAATGKCGAGPFAYQGNDYFYFADGTYCQYTSAPPDAASFPTVNPVLIPGAQSAGACGAQTVGTYSPAAGDRPANTVALNKGAMDFQLGAAPAFGHGFGAQCPGNVLSEFADLLGGSVGLQLARISFPMADVYHICAAAGAVGAWNGNDPTSPSSYNFSYLDSLLAAAVSGNADTKIILQVALDGSLPWVYAHPDCAPATPVALPAAVPASLPGAIPAGFACLSPTEQAQRMLQGIPDYLSPQWVTASTQVLDTLVAHIQASPYAANVVGYELMNGITLDNNFPVSYSSPSAVKRFESFLGQLYGSSSALAAAWRQPGLTFATAKPVVASQGTDSSGCPTVPASDPGLAQRSQLAPLFIPAAFQAYSDTRQFTVLSNEQVAFNFADAIKRATQGQALVGMRSGEFPPQQVWCNEQSNLVQWRTLGFFSYPSIDFYEVWEHYDAARYFGPSGGSGEPLMPVQGLGAFNKLYVVQNDFQVYDPDDAGSDTSAGLGYEPDYAGSIQKLRRVFVNALVNGMSEYLWQMSYHFDQPQLDPEWAQEQQVAQVAVHVDRSRVSELVYVMDPATGKYLADAYSGGYGGSPAPSTNADTFSDQPGQQLYLTQFPEQSWARSGVPYDTIFLDQLSTAKPYKVYVFFNTIGLSADQVKTIQSVLQANRAVGIFVYADGMVDGTGDAPLNALGTNISSLVGMPVVGTTQERLASIAPTASYLAAGGTVGDPGRWSFEPAAGTGLSIGTGIMAPQPQSAAPLLFPSFTINQAADSGVTVLATYTACGGDPASPSGADCTTTPAGAPAIAEKALAGGGDIIYSATPYLPPALIRYALHKAGAFQYSDTEDDLYLDASFVGIHTMDGSQRDGSVISNPFTAAISSEPVTLPTPAPSWTITLRFPSATALYDVFNSVEYPASSTQTIPVSADHTYLFYIGTQAAWQALGGH